MSNLQSQNDLQVLLDILPPAIHQKLDEINKNDQLLEIIMDLGRVPTARYVNGEIVLRSEEVTQEEIDMVVSGVGTFDDDNRAGIARTLHRISGIRNRRGTVVGLTCRVGRAVFGTLDIIADIVEQGFSILLLGRPGVGKTTMLREMARILSEKKRVIIVDTSNEIGGDGDIPHPAVGKARRMQVPRPSHQHETMIEAVENHNPEVIIIDEIGRELEAAAARTINERGVQLIGTAHGNSLENLLLNPTMSDLIGGIESVTLSDEEARRRGTQKTVLERRAPPTFDVLIELQERQQLLVHLDVALAVDGLLRGQVLDAEYRSYNEATGERVMEKRKVVASSTAVTGRREAGPVNGAMPPSPRTGNYQPSNGRSAHPSLPSLPTLEAPSENGKSLNVYAYGVARNRLIQAAKHLSVQVHVVEQLNDADVLVTLKSYYRKRRKLISDAEKQRTPVYILRANTVNQMESFLAQALNLNTVPSDHDPFDEALNEAERAVQLIHSGKSDDVALGPVGASLRRHQHQIARQANLVSHSYGKEPYRHVRIFNTNRNDILPTEG